jgi:hypothetical protein
LRVIDQCIIKQEFKELVNKYPGLTLLESHDGSWRIFGDLHFKGSLNEKVIEDIYSVLINIPKSYPTELPSVKELGGRIPNDFHTSGDDTLCLGTPILLKMRFYERPNLLGFVETCLFEYLYSYNYFQEYDKLPTGEYSHGILGILEQYQELFGIKQVETVLNLLQILTNNSYRGHHLCPCGSRTILRKCHGPTLLRLMRYQTPEEFTRDYMRLRAHLHAIQ